MSVVLLLLCALAGSALTSGLETGFYALNPLRLEHLARSSRRAALLVKLVRSPALLLITLLVLNNVVNDAAVQAVVDLLRVMPVLEHPFWSTVILTPVVFLFGEAWPKQWFLARPLERTLIFTPFLAAARLLLAPVSWPLLALQRLLGFRDEAHAGRHELSALLLESRRYPGAQAQVLSAALRAMETRGDDLRPFLRTGLPRLAPDVTLAAAQQQLAAHPAGLALLDLPSGPPRLLLGSRLATADPQRPLLDSALELPQLSGDIDLSWALRELRQRDATRALVGGEGRWLGVLDLEYALGRLLAPPIGEIAAAP